MAEKTKIQWADHTFNPWRGCQKVSPGCENCYAEKNSVRNPAIFGEWGPQGTRVIASDSMWKEPLRWNRKAQAAGERHRVFCASLADVFEDRPELVEPRRRLFDLIDQTHNMDWLLLTKRPENVTRLTPGYCPELVEKGSDVQTMTLLRPNVWLGTSVEDQQRANERIPILCQIPAAMRFLSVEPLLEEVELGLGGTCPKSWGLGYSGIYNHVHWVIVGGESGPGARHCHVDWIRRIVRDCKANDVPCFVKQLGANYCDPVNGVGGAQTVPPEEYGSLTRKLKDPKGGNPSEWPEDLRIREVPGD